MDWIRQAMIKEVLLIAGILLCLISCQQDLTKQNQELILGEWVPIFDDYLADVTSSAGYHFDKEYCENKVGYYEYFYQTGYVFEHPGVISKDEADFCDEFNDPYLYNVRRLYGYRTTYRIEKDTLHIFDLADKIWAKYHIRFSSKDTMILSNKYCGDRIPDRFVRKVYQIDEQPLIDQFIAYYPHNCYSKAKMYLIRRDGLFFSYGYYETGRFFIGQLRNNEFDQLDTLLKKAGMTTDLSQWRRLNVGRNSSNSFTMSEETFIVDNKMATIDNSPLWTISGNPEFYWAYLAGLFLPDLAKVKPFQDDEYPALLDEFDNFSSITLMSRRLFFSLSVTQWFYLGVLLCYAKEVEDIVFEPKYTLSGLRDKNKTMQTDGRYFRYQKKDGKTVTLDIGFNFVEVNELEKHKAYPVLR